MASLDSVPTMTLITVYEQFHLFTGFSQCAFGECECSSFTFYLLSPLILAFAFLLFFLSLFFCFVMHLRQTVSYRFVLVLFFLVCSCFWRFCACFCSNFFFLELHFCGWQGHSFCIATTWQCCQKFYESVFVGAFCFHFFWLKKESHMVFFFSCIFLGGRDTLFLISWVFSNSFVEVFVVALVSCFVSSSHLFKNWDILRSVAMHMRFFPPVWNSIFFVRIWHSLEQKFQMWQNFEFKTKTKISGRQAPDTSTVSPTTELILSEGRAGVISLISCCF